MSEMADAFDVMIDKIFPNRSEKMIKVRLIDTTLPEGKQVVGYQESRYHGAFNSLIPYYSRIGKNAQIWGILNVDADNFTLHDVEDRSTGEKDKNGVEIYENDKVKCWKLQDTLIKRDKTYNPNLKITSGMIEGYATAIIKFDGWSFKFEQLTGSDWFFYGPDGSEFNPKMIVSPRFEWIEVIGRASGKETKE